MKKTVYPTATAATTTTTKTTTKLTLTNNNNNIMAVSTCTGGALRVSEIAFRGSDSELPAVMMSTEDVIDSMGFGGVADRSPGPVGFEVKNVRSGN